MFSILLFVIVWIIVLFTSYIVSSTVIFLSFLLPYICPINTEGKLWNTKTVFDFPSTELTIKI